MKAFIFDRYGNAIATDMVVKIHQGIGAAVRAGVADWRRVVKLLERLTYRPETDSFVDSSGRVVDTDSREFVSLNAKYEFVFACVIHTACFWIGLVFGMAGPLGIAWRWSGIAAALLAASHGAGPWVLDGGKRHQPAVAAPWRPGEGHQHLVQALWTSSRGRRIAFEMCALLAETGRAFSGIQLP